MNNPILEHKIYLLQWAKNPAPKYNTGKRTIVPKENRLWVLVVPGLCAVTADLNQIPRSAFKKVHGPQGWFYEVDIAIAVVFGSTIEFQYLYDGKIVGEASVDYD